MRSPTSWAETQRTGIEGLSARAGVTDVTETGRVTILSRFASRRVVVPAVVAGALLAVTGCASTGQRPGVGMMGGTSNSPSGGVMGGPVAGYHYSQLACTPPGSLPGRVVTVTLADMGMTQMMGGTAPLGVRMMLRASEGSVSSGQVSLVAENMGWRTHELLILPLATGATVGHRLAGADGKVPETGSLGEASASCATGSGDGITARSAGWVTLTLKPGRYELLCNLPNHYADGMWTELDVA